MPTPTQTKRSTLSEQPNRIKMQTIQRNTDRVLATIRPDDSSKLAALRAEKSLTYLSHPNRVGATSQH